MMQEGGQTKKKGENTGKLDAGGWEGSKNNQKKGQGGARGQKTQDTKAKQRSKKKETKKGAGRSERGAPRPRAPRTGRHKKPETAGAREGGREDRRKTNQTKKRQKKKSPKRGQPQPGGGRTKMKDKTATGKVGRTGTGQGGPPAPPSQEEHAPTHTRDPGVGSSDLKGEMLASTRNSPGAPADFPCRKRNGTRSRTRK